MDPWILETIERKVARSTEIAPKRQQQHWAAGVRVAVVVIAASAVVVMLAVVSWPGGGSGCGGRGGGDGGGWRRISSRCSRHCRNHNGKISSISKTTFDTFQDHRGRSDPVPLPCATAPDGSSGIRMERNWAWDLGPRSCQDPAAYIQDLTGLRVEGQAECQGLGSKF